MTFPISIPADNAAPYTWTPSVRAGIAAANDHEARLVALEAGGGSWTSDFYVDSRDYGAVGDYIVSGTFAGTGTENIDFINNALDASQGRPVILPPGRCKVSAPISLSQGNELMGAYRELHGAAVNSQGSQGMSSLEFYGGPTENCIEALFQGVANSKAAVHHLAIYDRRTSPTSGNGIHYDKVVNGTIIKKVTCHGFKTGSSIWVASSVGGTTSDCVTIEDIWTFDAIYGVYLGNHDNNCFVRDIKSGSDSWQVAAVRIGATTQAVTVVEGIKHETPWAQAVTLLLEGSARGTTVDGVVQRAPGTGGPVLRCTGDLGGVHIRELIRAIDGVLLDVTGGTTPWSLSGTRYVAGQGGPDSYRWNKAELRSEAATPDVLLVPNGTRLYAAGAANEISSAGRVAIVPETVNQQGLVVQGRASQVAAPLRVLNTDGSNGTCFQVVADGSTTISKQLNAGAAIKTSKKTNVADAAYTILATDYRVYVTSLTAARTLTLPSASTVGDGFQLVIKDKSGLAGTHNITVARSGSQTIDGATNYIISTNWGAVQLESDGTNWSVIGSVP